MEKAIQKIFEIETMSRETIGIYEKKKKVKFETLQALKSQLLIYL